MRKKEICGCGTQIEADRQALDLDNCAKCASKIPGNILQKAVLDPEATPVPLVVVAERAGYGKAVISCNRWPDVMDACKELLELLDEVKIKKVLYTEIAPKMQGQIEVPSSTSP